MHKTIFLSFVMGVIGFLVFLMPEDALAAQLVFKTIPNSAIGDGATLVEVRIDPQSKSLNVIEGIINFQGEISEKLSVEVEIGGSALTLWPVSPKYISSEKVIRFTGGVPKGFDYEGLLFRMRIFSSETGNAVISWIGGTAYLNDGEGTQEPISARSLSINLDRQDQENVAKFSPDNTPPSFDATEIGRDSSLYDGKYFISFHAIDDISGVEHYEVKEGETITNVSEGIYIFKDQNRKTAVTIIAYDKAGNSEMIKIPPKINWINYVIIFIIAVVFSFFFFRYKNKKNF